MLLAFINPSGPTREPQELAVLLNNIALILVQRSIKERALCGEGLVRCRSSRARLEA